MDKAFDLVMGVLRPQMDFMPITDEDYLEEDGLIYCAKCKTPKQMRLKILNTEYTVKVLCECQAEIIDREEAADKERKKQMRLDRWREVGIQNAAWDTCSFEQDDKRDEAASDKAVAYANNFEKMFDSNMGLMLYGGLGSGKTYLAACITNYLAQHGHKVLMTNLSSLISAMNKDFGEEKEWWLDKVAGADLLVLDDFGAERTTEYSLEQMYEVINTRYKASKPLIITTNLSMSDIRNEQSQMLRRTYDRLIEMTLPVPVKGDSRRKEIALSKWDEMKDILEGKA